MVGDIAVADTVAVVVVAVEVVVEVEAAEYVEMVAVVADIDLAHDNFQFRSYSSLSNKNASRIFRDYGLRKTSSAA